MMETLFLLIRCVVALGAGFVGWILGGPAIRSMYRLAARKPAPGWLGPIGKFAGAVLVAFLVFLFLPLGGGSGLGWGPGWGSGAGGAGGNSEGGKGKGDQGTPHDLKKDGKGAPVAREKLEIELLGGAKITGEGRYYLLKRLPPAKTLPEVEAELKDRASKVEVHLVFTDQSVAENHGAVRRLRDLLGQLQIPTLIKQEK